MKADSSTPNGETGSCASSRGLRALAAGAVVLIAAICSGGAHAGVTLGGTVSSPNPSLPNNPGNCNWVGHAGDQSNLSANYVSGNTDFATFTATTFHSSAPCGAGASGLTGGVSVFTIDLGTNYLVDALAHWSTDNFGLPFLVYSILFDQDATYGNGNDSLVVGNLLSFNAPWATVTTFGAPVYARYFHFVVGPTPLGFTRIGELVLSGVPEPGTLALAGISLVGLGAWRMRDKPARAFLLGSHA